ncbi:MAG: Arm DNA-binding domain-containing protein [Butyricimonas faecihominis]
MGISILPKYWDFEKNRPTSKCPNKELIEKIILDKQVEYQRQILEFVADQKEYTAALLVESKKVKLMIRRQWESSIRSCWFILQFWK